MPSKSHTEYRLTCEHCGGGFVAINKPRRRFCSRRCAGLAQQPARRIIPHHAAVCVVCGAGYRQADPTRETCSTECRRFLWWWRRAGPVRVRAKIAVLRQQLGWLEAVQQTGVGRTP